MQYKNTIESEGSDVQFSGEIYLGVAFVNRGANGSGGAWVHCIAYRQGGKAITRVFPSLQQISPHLVAHIKIQGAVIKVILDAVTISVKYPPFLIHGQPHYPFPTIWCKDLRKDSVLLSETDAVVSI